MKRLVVAYHFSIGDLTCGQALFYHSNCANPGIAAFAEVGAFRFFSCAVN